MARGAGVERCARRQCERRPSARLSGVLGPIHEHEGHHVPKQTALHPKFGRQVEFRSRVCRVATRAVREPNVGLRAFVVGGPKARGEVGRAGSNGRRNGCNGRCGGRRGQRQHEWRREIGGLAPEAAAVGHAIDSIARLHRLGCFRGQRHRQHNVSTSAAGAHPINPRRLEHPEKGCPIPTHNAGREHQPAGHRQQRQHKHREQIAHDARGARARRPCREHDAWPVVELREGEDRGLSKPAAKVGERHAQQLGPDREAEPGRDEHEVDGKAASGDAHLGLVCGAVPPERRGRLERQLGQGVDYVDDGDAVGQNVASTSVVNDVREVIEQAEEEEGDGVAVRAHRRWETDPHENTGD